ncbi:membrane protein [Streptomyces laurentii]|uniref:Membrane protein n=1 Tax=Streptomyces laurentii TaxID=39478 RepID=A0A160NYY7_STRLU|nr:membrane protein [Streptomyces laurentii]
MSLHATAANLVTLANEGAEHGGNHESLSPFVTGGGALLALLLLLWITTRFNRDR